MIALPFGPYYILIMPKKSNPQKTAAEIEVELQTMLHRTDEFIGMRAERDEANYRKEKAERELQAIKASRTWKIGRFVLAPYRWIARKK